MNRTNIEWVKNPDGSQGFTLNSKTGCLNHVDGLCKGGGFPCYAYKLAHGRLSSRYMANMNVIPETVINDKTFGKFAVTGYLDPFYPRWWPEHLIEPVTRGKPSSIFLDDMADWVADYWPEEWTRTEIQLMKACPQHRFYTLTKQPQNLIKWSPFPDNCWVGVTATDTRMALEACLKLGDIDATVRYLSIEPMLNPINLPPEHLRVCKIGWLIIGAQTGPKKLPDWEWVKAIIEAADKASVPIFLKNNLGLPKYHWAGASPYYRKDQSGTMVLRQELPR